MKTWQTDKFSKSGKAHLWHVSPARHHIRISECGRLVFAVDLQPEAEALGRCKKCERHDLSHSAAQRSESDG